ncbi:GyrI-like domain-containing protein [Bdellovibrio sp. HCB337]|uniref:GyrI-like domain-containing protein n=1 Tax=Bdellovibrio sp. HCB337 TaxID=3394358 RepID=UPI0039A7520D
MKLLRSFLLASVLAIVTLVIYLATHLGAFKSVDISEGNRPAMKMIYKDHTGSYHKIVATIEEVEKWAKENNIPCTESFGEYIDDANKVEEARLRSRGGCIVDAIPANLPEGIQSREIPARKYVVAIFEGSPGIGPLKVYPKAETYMKERQLVMDGSVIEIYVIHSSKTMTTTYLFPLAAPVPSAPTQ